MTISLENRSPSAPIWQRRGATWQDYVQVRDSADCDWRKIAFYQGSLWAGMGKEEPNHAALSDLLTRIFGFWTFLHPEVALQSYGRCLIEKPMAQACAPDWVLYRGEAIPKWQPDEPQLFDLTRHRLPDLVGEIANTSLSLDLDEQKQLYASLGIPDYWVVDVKGLRLFAFSLAAPGLYETIQVSRVLTDLPIALIEQALERAATETTTAAANGVMQPLQAFFPSASTQG